MVALCASVLQFIQIYQFVLVTGFALTAVIVINALYLRNIDKLSEASFLRLMELALRKFFAPLTRRKGHQPERKTPVRQPTLSLSVEAFCATRFCSFRKRSNPYCFADGHAGTKARFASHRHHRPAREAPGLDALWHSHGAMQSGLTYDTMGFHDRVWIEQVYITEAKCNWNDVGKLTSRKKAGSPLEREQPGRRRQSRSRTGYHWPGLALPRYFPLLQ